MVEEEPEPVADEDEKSEEDGKGILPTVAEEEEDEQEVPEVEEKGEEGVPEEKGEEVPMPEHLGVIVPDLLPPAASSDRPPTEEQAQQREEPESGRPSSAAEEAHGHKPETAPARVHQFLGTTALALPAERDHRLDRVDLELQIRPQSPNGVILYAASSAPSAKEPPPTVHSLQLRNGQVHYSFRLGSETNEEVLRSEAKVPLGQWTTLRVSNDGQGRASLRLNSSAPIELFYSRPPSVPSATPSRIFLGGIDPQRSRQRPATAAAAAESVNFIGALGRVRLNQKLLKADGEPASRGLEPSREEEEEEEESSSGSGSSLQQTENQCSRQPCLDGGRCRLDRWGGFQCQCAPGFAGPLCEFPSSDGVCPADGRRWCHRGICLWQQPNSADGGRPLCLCPPGWAGDRCERKEANGGDGDGIRFDGRHSFLAIPLDQWQDEDRETGMDETGGFSVEFRLNPAPSKPREDHFVAMLIRRDQTGPVAVLGLQGGQKFWALEQESGDQPSNRRFLTKRIKHRKMHRVRLEQLGPGELRLLVEGRPKGTLRADSGRTALLLLGGPAPRGQLASSNSLLAGIAPFAGCMDQLRVNGRPLDWSELAKLATAANMGTCRAESSEKGPEREKSQEVVGDRRDFLVQTTLMPIPYTQLPVESASEDPPLTQRRQEAELTGPEGEAIDGSEPTTTTTTMVPTTQQTFWSDQITGTVSPDPLPSSTDRSAFVEEMPAGEAEEWEEPSASTTTEEPSPAAEEEPSSSTTRASASEDPLFSTDEPLPPETTSIWSEEEAEEEPPTTLSSSTTATSTTPPAPEPTWAIGPDSAELLEGPFPGLCDHKTCGPHGNCEELNETHVFCDCRDYWVGQTCELFRPIEYAASFDGNAFVVFSSDELPHLVSDREEVIEFKLRTRAHYGLIFWQGQQPSLDMEVDLATEDFLSIGLLDGHLTFSYELGGGAAQLISEQRVNDGRPHQIRAVRKGRNSTLVVDGGPPVRGRSSGILAMLNVEGHIFVGGVPDLHLMTAGIHTHNLVGCLAELVLNGHRLDLMANAIDGRNVRPCREWRPHRHRRGRRLLRQWRRLLRRRRQQRQLNRTIVIRN